MVAGANSCNGHGAMVVRILILYGNKNEFTYAGSLLPKPIISNHKSLTFFVNHIRTAYE